MKKQVNVRLNPAYIVLLNRLQQHYRDMGFNYSQADIIEISLAYHDKKIEEGKKINVTG